MHVFAWGIRDIGCWLLSWWQFFPKVAPGTDRCGEKYSAVLGMQIFKRTNILILRARLSDENAHTLCLWHIL